MIKFRCEHCGQKVGVPLDYAGRRVRCPGCKRAIVAPAGPESSAVLEAESASASATATGLGHEIGGDDPFGSGGFGHRGAAAGGDDWLSQLAESEAQASAAVAHADHLAHVCPQCKAQVKPGAVLCVSCGYRFDTGKSVETRVVEGEQSPWSLFVTEPGRMLVASGAALAGVVLGCLLWVVVALGTQHEAGWPAWGVGLLAGVGATMGARMKNVAVASVAVVLAIGGLAVGKAVVSYSGSDWVFEDPNAGAESLLGESDWAFTQDQYREAVLLGMQADGEMTPVADEAFETWKDTREPFEYRPDLTALADARLEGMSEADKQALVMSTWVLLVSDESRSVDPAATTGGLPVRPFELVFFGLAAVSAYGLGVGSDDD